MGKITESGKHALIRQLFIQHDTLKLKQNNDLRCSQPDGSQSCVAMIC